MNDHENCTASGAMNFSESLKRQWTRNRLPYAVLLELTPRCNFNCVHCYLQDHHAEDFLSKDDVIQMLDLLYDEGILFLTLTGGEVLTRKDFAEIYAYAKRKGFLMEVFTNGYALTEEVIALFQQLPPLLVDISLYGSCEETYQKITGVSGAFAKVTENCRRLKQAGVRTNLKSPVLTRE
jgi:MoaA/NifB/PqqE/SkfB family radical SAM enzyme